MTTVSPAAMTRNEGAKAASFWWTSRRRFGRSKCSGSPSGLSRYTTIGPVSLSETPCTPSPIRPRTSPAAQPGELHRSASATAIARPLEVDTDLHPEEVRVVGRFLDVRVGDPADQRDVLPRVLALQRDVVADRQADDERVRVELVHVVADRRVAEVQQVASVVVVSAQAARTQRDVRGRQARRDQVELHQELREPVDQVAVVGRPAARVETRTAVREPEARVRQLHDRVAAEDPDAVQLVRSRSDRLAVLEALHTRGGAERARNHLAQPDRREGRRRVRADGPRLEPTHREVQPLPGIRRELETQLLRSVGDLVHLALAVGHRERVTRLAIEDLSPELDALVPEPG